MSARAPRPIDASVLLGPGTPEWPGDVPYTCGWTCTIAGGAPFNLSAITLSPHLGTHADAPLHVRDGWPASETLAIDAFLGPAVVLDLREVPAGPDPEGPGALTLASLATHARAQGVELSAVLREAPRLLLRTGRTIADGRFPDAWPWVDAAAVTTLVAGGLRLLGVDAPSIDARESKSLATHQALFGGGACNLENLDLRGAAPGRYGLLALPLRLAGLDGAPVRALLVPDA